MGQRSQIYIKMHNPAKVLDNIDPQLKKALGRKNTTILPFHNQWMYGHFSLICALNVLNHCKQMEPSSRKLNKDGRYEHYDGSTTPFCPQFNDFKYNSFDKWMSQIEFITNFVAESPYRDSGMMGAREIISECIEDGKYDSRWDCAKNPLMGDNNDGILVIDFIECKYCFVNISDYDYKADGFETGTHNLEYLVPASALEYLDAYNPTENNVPKYWLENKTEEQIENELKENAEMRVYFEEQFKDFEVMTQDELFKMFPKFKEEKEPKQLTA